MKFAEVVNLQGEKEFLKLDIYCPQDDAETNRPVILWIHGGGFQPGIYKDGKNIVEFAGRFSRKGYVCISADYRLRDNPGEDFKGTMSDAIADVSSALEWIRINGEAYGMDSKRIFIAGGSAGGIIAVNICYGDGSYGQQTDLSGVLAIINLWGSPTDCKLVVHSDSLPALIVHGTADQVVKFENSLKFVEHLQQAGVHHVFIPLEGATHTPMTHFERMDFEISLFLHGILSSKSKVQKHFDGQPE
jgi:acetyl esterase/lipase